VGNSTNIDLPGIRGSGKSTVMKQLHYIHSNGFSEEERRKARSVILISLLRNFKDLLRNMDDEGITFDTEIAKVTTTRLDPSMPGRVNPWILWFCRVDSPFHRYLPTSLRKRMRTWMSMCMHYSMGPQ
jgi:hypothetical protein